MSTNGPPIKIKVQKRFYVLLACIGLLFLYFAWGIVKPASVNKQAQALAQPAALAPFHYPFQSPAEEARFISVPAQQIPSSSSFYSGYSHNKGLPATFIAYVLPPTSTEAVNYFTDKNNIYVPAVFITRFAVRPQDFPVMMTLRASPGQKCTRRDSPSTPTKRGRRQRPKQRPWPSSPRRRQTQVKLTRAGSRTS